MDHHDRLAAISSPDRPQAERAKVLRLRAEETAESGAIGAANWQARAELSPHQEAVAPTDKLRREGRRWKFLAVPPDNENEAQEPARQISREAPPDATARAGHAPALVPFMGM